MKPFASIFRAAACALLLAAGAGLPPACALAEETATLSVTGNLVNPLTLKLPDIEKLPQTEIAVSRAVGSGQEQETVKTTYRGVLLRDILQAAGLKEQTRLDFRKTLFVAKARDGYIALFTWAELFNTKIGDSVLVILQIDGKPVDAEERFPLRSLADIRPGPRHVKWLERIEVMQIGN